LRKNSLEDIMENSVDENDASIPSLTVKKKNRNGQKFTLDDIIKNGGSSI
jgi:hypothetical protein